MIGYPGVTLGWRQALNDLEWESPRTSSLRLVAKEEVRRAV